MEDAVGVLGQLHTAEGCRLDCASDLVDRSVEPAHVDVEGRFLGQSGLFDDLLEAGAQLDIITNGLRQLALQVVELARVWCHVGQDGELGDVGVVFGIETSSSGCSAT